MLAFILQYGFFATLAAYGAGALFALVFGIRKYDDSLSSIIAHACAAIGGLFGLIFSVALLLSGGIFSAEALSMSIAPNIFDVRIDGLAAIFLSAISVVALAASLFGISYQKQFLGHYRLPHFGFFYNVFLAGMVFVISANNGILFLFAWELMAIASYFLVIFERKEAANIRAGALYLLISQAGAAFLFAAFLFLYRYTGSWDFDVIRETAGSLPILIQNSVLALALIGFASKAGVIPLHIWLPEAHPAAPSHVSALMSGVMIKTAIFMIVRFFLDFFSDVHFSWGMLIIALGAISSLFGVLYALSEHDIKRLLAFHSVENIGIILLGVGASITFFAFDLPAAGILALIAGLYHTVNHALFKSLLFLSAGSVVHAMHTRNMEEYGGLIKVLPWTAFFFLIGAAAISGLPPLNGFVSEWLTFQSLFAGIALLPLFPKVIFLIGAASLAFTGGLAAACFVKAFGTTFLARSRSAAQSHAHESYMLQLWSMGLLASLCALFGIGASTVISILTQTVAGLLGGVSGGISLAHPVQMIELGGFSALGMVSVATALAFGIATAYLFTFLTSRAQKVTVARTWDCGAPLTPRMEITASGFSRSLITIFRGLLRPTTQTTIEYHDATMRYFAKSRTVHISLPDLYRTYIYEPVVLVIERGARGARKIQTGNLNTYLLYMFLTLLALLSWALK